MDDLIADLNYDFNFNLIMVKQLICHLESKEDRQCAIKWAHFFLKSDQSLPEMQLRNDFMHYLVLNLQEGFLRPPFDSLPPDYTKTKLVEISHLIPDRSDKCSGEDSQDDKSDVNDDRPIVMSKSPDGGVFLSRQPIPHEGSFCYLAITSKKKNN